MTRKFYYTQNKFIYVYNIRKNLYPTGFVLGPGTQHSIDFSINRQGIARGYTYNPYNWILCDPESEVNHAS